MRGFALALAITAAALAGKADAHHSFDGSFSRAALVTVKGEVTEFRLTNPHVYMKLAVKDAKGAVTTWHVETTSATRLQAEGWTQNSIKAGDQLVVSGYAAKDGRPYMRMEWVRRTDGRSLALWLPGPLMPLPGA